MDPDQELTDEQSQALAMYMSGQIPEESWFYTAQNLAGAGPGMTSMATGENPFNTEAEFESFLNWSSPYLTDSRMQVISDNFYHCLENAGNDPNALNHCYGASQLEIARDVLDPSMGPANQYNTWGEWGETNIWDLLTESYDVESGDFVGSPLLSSFMDLWNEETGGYGSEFGFDPNQSLADQLQGCECPNGIISMQCCDNFGQAVIESGAAAQLLEVQPEAYDCVASAQSSSEINECFGGGTFGDLDLDEDEDWED